MYFEHVLNFYRLFSLYPNFNKDLSAPLNSQSSTHTPYELSSTNLVNTSQTDSTNLQHSQLPQSNEKINPTVTKSKKIKSVKFEQDDDNLVEAPLSDHENKRGLKNTRGKRGRKSTRGATKPTTTRILRNTSKKKGIMDIAVDKIVEISEISEEDTMQLDEQKKSESFMDTDDDL